MKAVGNYVIVEVTSTLEDDVPIEYGSLRLQRGTRLIENQLDVAKEYGTVVSVSDRVYKETGLQSGDKVHFHFHCIKDHYRLDLHKLIFAIELSDIFYYERNDELIMINDYCLVEFVHEAGQDSGIKHVSKIHTTDSGIVKAIGQLKQSSVGVIKAISNNDKWSVGQKVVYSNKISDKLTIKYKGNDYLRFTSDYIVWDYNNLIKAIHEYTNGQN